MDRSYKFATMDAVELCQRHLIWTSPVQSPCGRSGSELMCPACAVLLGHIQILAHAVLFVIQDYFLSRGKIRNAHFLYLTKSFVTKTLLHPNNNNYYFTSNSRGILIRVEWSPLRPSQLKSEHYNDFHTAAVTKLNLFENFTNSNKTPAFQYTFFPVSPQLVLPLEVFFLY